MLKTAFVGNGNRFNRLMAEWLSEHTDLSVIIWTDNLFWARGSGLPRAKRIASRFRRRSRRLGTLRALDEVLYYVVYKAFLQDREEEKIGAAVQATVRNPRTPLELITQVRPHDIRSSDLQELIESFELDALFAMCTDVYLPDAILRLPRLGCFLWHEGITPEYRGVYSPFWALVKREFHMLGYTLLKMNAKLDAGEIYLQGQGRDIDPMRDWHSYIGHKSVIDSLSEGKSFLNDLERGCHRPIRKPNAVDGYYSYPTVTGLLRILGYRIVDRLQNGARRQPSQIRATLY